MHLRLLALALSLTTLALTGCTTSSAANPTSSPTAGAWDVDQPSSAANPTSTSTAGATDAPAANPTSTSTAGARDVKQPGRATKPKSTSPARSTPATTTARTMHIVLEANVTGDGEATAAYVGDPTDPDGGVDAFRAHWTREFDIGYQDWAALEKVHVTVTERSGLNATVSCTTFYDNTVGGYGEKAGPFKAAGCHISYGDSGDGEE